MDLRLLESIGLTQGEAKVYLALLKLGETKTGPLAKEAQVSSSKVYKILDRLINKGLAGQITKGKIQYFSSIEPKRLAEFIDKKEEEIEKERTIINDILPELELIRNSSKKPNATIYEGFKAITNFFKNILDELKKDDVYYVIGENYGDVKGLREFFYNYHSQRAKKGIIVKMLANYNVKGNLEKTTHKKAYIRYLPELFASKMQITFYKDKAFIHLVTKNPSGFLIYNEEIVKSFKSYFETLWKIGKQQ